MVINIHVFLGALRALAKDRRNNTTNFLMNSSAKNTKNNFSAGSSSSAFASFNAMKPSASVPNKYSRQFYENCFVPSQSQFVTNQSTTTQPPHHPRNQQFGSTQQQLIRNPPVAISPQNSKNPSISNDRKGNNSFYHMADFTGGVSCNSKNDEQVKNKVCKTSILGQLLIVSLIT